MLVYGMRREILNSFIVIYVVLCYQTIQTCAKKFGSKYNCGVCMLFHF